MCFPLEQVLLTAASHPFYSKALSTGKRDLSAFPLSEKSTLHDGIQSALRIDPTFLRSVYISPTGGTSGNSDPLFFVTDVTENRRQREKMGQLMRSLHTIDENDIVLNLHNGRSLYRSLELSGDLTEYSGGTNIPAGFDFPDENLAQLASIFHTNAIMGTTSRLLIFARYLLSNPTISISFAKAIYTSETLPAHQEEYLRKAFHCKYIVSVYASAECGPWAVSLPSNTLDGSKMYREFVFDATTMTVEILDDDGVPVTKGEVGEIVVTSLMRLRNPLVRYRTGDIGSLHPYSVGKGVTSSQYRCIHLYGRHPGKSFNISGEYYDIIEIEKIMGQDRWGILQWQVILDSDHIGQREESAEFRVVLKDKFSGENQLDDLRLALLRLGGGFITADFSVRAVECTDLENSSMANKMRKIVDKR